MLSEAVDETGASTLDNPRPTVAITSAQLELLAPLQYPESLKITNIHAILRLVLTKNFSLSFAEHFHHSLLAPRFRQGFAGSSMGPPDLFKHMSIRTPEHTMDF